MRRGCAIVVVALVAVTGCTDPSGSARSSVDEDSGAAGGGLIDVDGGYTQAEQMAELETVVEIMRDHFGEDVATIDDEPWTAERHDAEIAPRPKEGELYNHVINFNVEPDDLEQTYATAEEIAEELGLTENLNNSHGITEHDKIFYGAGREEGCIFLMTGESRELFSASYTTRRSDHETIHEASDRVREKNRQERREQHSSDNPIEPEDLEVSKDDDDTSD